MVSIILNTINKIEKEIKLLERRHKFWKNQETKIFKSITVNKIQEEVRKTSMYAAYGRKVILAQIIKELKAIIRHQK